MRTLLNHQPTEPMTFQLKALDIGDRLNGNLILVWYAQSLTCASTSVQSICSINLNDANSPCCIYLVSYKHHICENTGIKSTLHVTRDTSCKRTKANPNLNPKKKKTNQIFNSSNFPTFFRESSVFNPFSSVARGACGANFSFLAHPKLCILARANAPRAGRPAVNKGRSLKHTSSPPGDKWDHGSSKVASHSHVADMVRNNH